MLLLSVWRILLVRMCVIEGETDCRSTSCWPGKDEGHDTGKNAHRSLALVAPKVGAVFGVPSILSDLHQLRQLLPYLLRI